MVVKTIVETTGRYTTVHLQRTVRQYRVVTTIVATILVRRWAANHAVLIRAVQAFQAEAHAVAAQASREGAHAAVAVDAAAADADNPLRKYKDSTQKLFTT